MKQTFTLIVAAMAFATFPLARAQSTEPKAGDPPPPLKLKTLLQAPEGTKASWGALKGKVVVLEFWAAWCGPCVGAIPHLNELAGQFKDRPVQFIAITDEDEKVIAPFLKKKPIHAWIGLDTDKSMFKDYGITSIPHTVVVDRAAK
jgi:thiol-disulfide isomerase/thioredoxin